MAPDDGKRPPMGACAAMLPMVRAGEAGGAASGGGPASHGPACVDDDRCMTG